VSAPAAPFNWRSIAVSAYGPSFLFGIAEGALFPVMAVSARALGASISQAGLITALWGIGALLSNLPAALIASRWGERRALVGSAMFCALALLLCLLANQVLWLALGLLLSAVLALLAPIWILGSSIVFVAGIALSVPGLNLLVATASAPDLRDLRGQATALYAFTLFVGTSFAPRFNQLVRGLPLAGIMLILTLALGLTALCHSAVFGKAAGADHDRRP